MFEREQAAVAKAQSLLRVSEKISFKKLWDLLDNDQLSQQVSEAGSYKAFCFVANLASKIVHFINFVSDKVPEIR
jgi:hypothetical protein